MAPSGQPDLEDLAPLPPLEAGAPQDPAAPPRRDATVSGVGLTEIIGSWMACILTSSSEGRSSKQTAAKHSSVIVGVGTLFFWRQIWNTVYHFEIRIHHSPIPFIFLKSPETDTVAVSWNRATEEITKISLATKCQSLWKKCSEAANDCCSQRDALPVNSQRYMQQAASPP